MMARIKLALVGLGAALLSVFALRSQHLKSQRDEARNQATRERAAHEAEQAARSVEQRINQKAQEVRKRNEQARQERNDTPADERRLGRFGTADRLHNADRD